MPDFTTDITKAAHDLTGLAKDATYVAIGAGVLGFQRAQVQRQELHKRLAATKVDGENRLRGAQGDLHGVVHEVDTRVEQLIARVGAVVAPFEDSLPEPARSLAQQVHVQAGEARTQLRDRILNIVG
jgi:hypothetical protein